MIDMRGTIITSVNNALTSRGPMTKGEGGGIATNASTAQHRREIQARPRTFSKAISPVGYRAGGHPGSVAGQDAVILAVNSGVVPRVPTLQGALGAARPDRRIGLTLRTARRGLDDDGPRGDGDGRVAGGGAGVHDCAGLRVVRRGEELFGFRQRTFFCVAHVVRM